MNFDLISWRNHRMKMREIPENENRTKPKFKMKLTQIMIQK